MLLVGAARVGSTGLRTVVRESGDLWLVAEVTERRAAVSAARQHRPDHIVFAADGLTGEGIALLRELRSGSLESTLTVCADGFDGGALVAAMQIPVDGILRWADVTDEALHETLGLGARGLRVMSAAVVEGLLGAVEPAADIPALTESEQAVFRCLEDGLGTAGIARELQLDLRGVQRAKKSFREKLGARDDYELGKIVQARRLHPGSVVVSRRGKTLTAKRH